MFAIASVASPVLPEPDEYTNPAAVIGATGVALPGPPE